MKLKRLVPSVIGSNTYLLFDNSGNAAVIDPGAPGNEILKAIKDENACLTMILLTHGHFDHLLGLERLRAEFPDAQIFIHADDAEMMSDGHKNAFFDFFKGESSVKGNAFKSAFNKVKNVKELDFTLKKKLNGTLSCTV